jgi:UDP-glucose 4-epimerase
MASWHAEVFFHLAAQMDVRHSIDDPLGDARRNVLGTVAVLEAVRLGGARKIVLASSGGTIYGDQDRYPVDESAPLDPHSPYAAAKICAGIYLGVYRHLYELQTTTLALGNVYGPRQDPGGEAGVVSIFAAALLAERPTVIFGDGDSTRDYVYVDDVVEAFLRAAGTAADGMRLNVGTGQEMTVREVHSLVAAAVERPDEPQFLLARAGELRHVGLDSIAAGQVLGWHARVDLVDGLARTVGRIRDSATVSSLQRDR